MADFSELFSHLSVGVYGLALTRKKKDLSISSVTFSSLHNKHLEVGWAEPNAEKKGFTEDCHRCPSFYLLQVITIT